MKSSMTEMDKKYQAEDDARTMQKAMEIKKDSARMKGAKMMMEKQMKAMQDAMMMGMDEKAKKSVKKEKK